RVAYSLATADLAELWVQDLVRNITTRFTFTPGVARNPVWSADGTSVYYGFLSAGGGGDVVFRKPAAGGGRVGWRVRCCPASPRRGAGRRSESLTPASTGRSLMYRATDRSRSITGLAPPP